MAAHVLDPVWIPLADGTRLAARVWLPAALAEASAAPAPVILEAIPYRRRDGTLLADHGRYAWWADAGFAGVRLDLRGTGDSEGLIEDEYLPGEQADIAEAIAWLAAQPWSNGRVGMIGYSWGGFNGLQVAALRPPALGAVVTIDSTTRRYTDDCHYTGGLVNAHDMLSWATTMLAFDARPPDPAVVGPGWREQWHARLGVAPPMIERWLAHQLEDGYWLQGSVCADWSAIACPVLAVGGWSDPYRNAVLELAEHLPGPRFGLIGPWAHGYPHDTEPGPNIDFLAECARFFGRYLRGDDNGYDDVARIRAYVQDYDAPAPRALQRSGRWVALPGWERGGPAEVLALASDGLVAGARAEPLRRQIAPDQGTGLAAGNWCPYGGPSQPLDQRADDALSLVFDGEPLAGDVEIFGFPRLQLRVRADRPQAFVAARLCDVAPTGESLLVTRGILNLAHRDGHGASEPLEPGAPVDVTLRLDAAGHRFAPGHRIRLALSPTYWPWIWPSPEAATLTVEAGELALPLLAGATPWEPGAPEQGETVAAQWLSASEMQRVVVDDSVAERIEIRSQPDFLAGRVRVPELDLEIESSGENVYTVARRDPLSAEVRCSRVQALSRPGFDVRIEADAHMRCTAGEFLVTTDLRAYEAGAEVAARRFETRVPRADAV